MVSMPLPLCILRRLAVMGPMGTLQTMQDNQIIIAVRNISHCYTGQSLLIITIGESTYRPGGTYAPLSSQNYHQHPGYGQDGSIIPNSSVNHTRTASITDGFNQDQGAMPRLSAGGGQPQGMFTRNLIGSVSVSAFNLCDTEEKRGIWFVLQDLSVRTEGNFRQAPFCNYFQNQILTRCQQPTILFCKCWPARRANSSRRQPSKGHDGPGSDSCIVLQRGIQCFLREKISGSLRKHPAE